jgi:pimeloyl-ACP methyl ester carboxylesterase
MKTRLLLVPGMLNNERLWRHVAPALADVADCVMPAFATQDSVAAMAAHALAMAGEGPFALAGFSLGGYVAQEIVALAPQRVQRLALIDTGSGAASGAEGIAMQKTAAAAAKDFAKVLERMLPGSIHPSRSEDGALREDLVGMWSSVGAQAFIRHCSAAATRPDRSAVLGRFRGPVTVICGREDQVQPPALSRELAALCGLADVQWIEACGHLSPLERPQELAALLRRWLAA